MGQTGRRHPHSATIRCYARCGFTVYSVDPQVIAVDGALYDELLMVKNLSWNSQSPPEPQ